ncbi:hypothetical protein QPK13_21120 [Photorhabdus tasmaniensis]
MFHHHVIAVQLQPAAARDADHLMLFVVMAALLVTHVIAAVAQAAYAVIIKSRIVINLFARVTDFPGVFRRVYQRALRFRAKTTVAGRDIRKGHDIAGRGTPE